MVNQFLWVIYPYIVLTVFIVGHLYRFKNGQFGWTAKSSEFLEKRTLKWGSTFFHWGIICVFFGHVAGLLVPLSVYHALGVSDHVYHMFAVIGGGAAGIAAVFGIGILLTRRVSFKRIRKTSTISDFVAVFLLAVVIICGVTATGSNIGFGGTEFDYRATIGPWVREIFVFHPDLNLMVDSPILFKIHILAALTLFLIWPFTRLVHVFSFPITYINRNYVLYRKRGRTQSAAKKRVKIEH